MLSRFRKPLHLIVGTCAFLLMALGAATPGRVGRALAQDNRYVPSASDFGGVGLLQTRTARFGPDGQFDVGFSLIQPYERYLITLQALPWLEATFRYTSVQDRDFQGNVHDGTGSSFKDRGADLKLRVLRERKYLPTLAVGLQDGLGTGLFSGEYIVASKRFFDLDFSLGMGWGYSAGAGTIKNPLTYLSDAFKVRGDSSAQGGTLVVGNWFRGENVGLFGGVEYSTPLKGLSLKLEYDPNDYESEPLNNKINARSHYNLGFNYRPFAWVDLSAAYERGRDYMLRISLRANFNDEGIPKIADPPPPELKPRKTDSVPSSLGTAQVVAALQAPTEIILRPDLWPSPLGRMPARSASEGMVLQNLSDEGFGVDSIRIDGNEAVIILAAASRFDARDAAQIVATTVPSSVDRIKVSTVRRGASSSAQIFGRKEMELAAIVDYLFDEFESWDLDVVGLEFANGEATVLTIGDPPHEAKLGAASALYKTAPFPIHTVVFSSAGQYSAPSRITRSALVSSRPGLSFVPRSPHTQLNRTGDVAFVLPRLQARGLDIDQAIDDDKDQRLSGLFEALKEAGIVVDAAKVTKTSATVYVTPRRFRQIARNIGRAARVVANNVPASVEELTIVLISGGLETGRVTIFRKDLENAVNAKGSVEEIFAHAIFEGPKSMFIPKDAVGNPGRYPKFGWSAVPLVRQHIGGGDNFYLYQLWAALSGSVDVVRGLSANGTIGRNIYNNFDRITTEPPGGELHKVRSDIKEYLQQGQNNIVRLQTQYMAMPLPDLYVRLSAGLFEEMYGGYGGEVLYRPFASRFAAGVDLNWVRQREFDQQFDFRDYSVITGHVNLYWDTPFYDLLGQLHIGQYLAGDRGATMQLSRRFDSGIRAGAWVTLTNVPFEVFGEGSFDKGFFFTLPFDLFTTQSTTRSGIFAFRPLSKDGGQRLNITPRLYDITAGGNLDGITRDWDRLLD